jgi:uncharacterized protein (DUF427 family)
MTDHVRLEPAGRIRIRAAGQSIVDTTRGYVVHEVGLPDRYYVPRDEVRAEIADGQGGARCPWKGLWKHLDVIIPAAGPAAGATAGATAGGQRISNAGWTYYEATPTCAPIQDFIAFYPTKVDAIDVG